MVSILVVRPIYSRIVELKWNHIAKPVVRRRADNAPVRGQGLGFTM